MDGAAFIALAIFIAATAVAAASGARFKPGEWYENLNHPWFRPPNWIFPVTWTILYCMIAASAFFVWRASGWTGATTAFLVFFIQLGLNSAWSWIFFGLHRPDLALYEAVALWLSILTTILLFAPHSALAAWLLLPYLVWVAFAVFLNWTLWRLNPRPVPRQRRRAG